MTRPRPGRLTRRLALLVVACAAVSMFAAGRDPVGEWRYYSGDNASTKQSFAYVLDRTNGTPVWPMEERPVPQSTVPGEKTSPTQLFPSKPPPFDRQGVSVDQLIDFTPELRAQAIEITKKYVTGPVFTPPSIVASGPADTKGTIQLPGSVGGADWTGAAFDPETGMLYIPSMTNPFVANLVPGDPKETNLRFRASTPELL